jgi:hypothetical protein
LEKQVWQVDEEVVEPDAEAGVVAAVVFAADAQGESGEAEVEAALGAGQAHIAAVAVSRRVSDF